MQHINCSDGFPRKTYNDVAFAHTLDPTLGWIDITYRPIRSRKDQKWPNHSISLRRFLCSLSVVLR